MQFQGRLKYIHGQRKKAGSGATLPPQLGLFCIAVPLLLPPIGEMKLKDLLLKTKHRLDLSPVTLDVKGKAAEGWSDAGLRARSGCHYLHFTDMLYCTENQIRMMNSGENGLTVFRVLTKDGQCVWLQTNGHLPYRNKSPEYAAVPQEALKDAEGSKDEHLRKQSDPGQADSSDRLVYSDCNDTSLQYKHLYEQQLAKEGAREEKYEPIRNDGGVSHNEPLNFCTSFPRAPKVSMADDLWLSEYSRAPPRSAERMSDISVRVAKPSCGRSRLLSEPQLRADAQAPSFQNVAQSFGGVGEGLEQTQPYYCTSHYADPQAYPAQSCKSHEAGPVADLVSRRPAEPPAGYCDSAEMFHGVHVKSEYHPDPRNGLDGPMGSPSRLWAEGGGHANARAYVIDGQEKTSWSIKPAPMGGKTAASFPGQPQLKCDPDTPERFPPCDKLTALLPAPFCGSSAAKGGGPWRADRACGLDRSPKHERDVVHFSPQRAAAHSRCAGSNQPVERPQAQAVSRRPVQGKGPGQEAYKLPLQFKGRGLIHTVIKREPSPSPSPPWSRQTALQRSMPSCLINSMTQKITQNAYL
ncbi:uncharacterized protein [Heptranchias perlo]|uniref:uncharacterized protein n=1 Tax=Heptranchias perlo TaxID=212740 RepID=UPI00355A19ED